jgi:tRNA dimethylallyltransferase
MLDEVKKLPKMVALLGPTACGKTSWGLSLAKKYNGEIISADSRQIYKKMNIGTAKPAGIWKWQGLKRIFSVDEVPHHLMDFLDPGRQFTVAEYRDRAVKYIKLCIKQGKTPFLVGGTGLYIQSVVDNYEIPRVEPNKKLRLSLESKTSDELFSLLNKLDPEMAKIIDKKNKRRMIRALEVCIFTGKPFSSQRKKNDAIFDVLMIGIEVPRNILYDRIDMRVDDMIVNGLENEINGLLRQKYPWHLPSMCSIGYRQFKNYKEGKLSFKKLVEIIKFDTHKYARRQITWFKKDKRIKWVSKYEDAEKLVKDFFNLQ